MNSKKVLSLVLCMCMLASLLTGCGLGGNSAVDVQLDADSQITAPVGVNAAAEGAGEDLSEEILLADEAEINYETNFVKGTDVSESVKKTDTAGNKMNVTTTDVKVKEDPAEEPEAAPEEGVVDEKILQAIDKNLNGGKEDTADGTVSGGSADPDEPFDVEQPGAFEDGVAEYADNTILVKIEKNFSQETLDGLNAAGVGKLDPMFELEEYSWYTAYLVKDTDVNAAMEQIRQTAGVETAEYNFKYEAAVSDAEAAVEAEVKDNPKLGDQWHHNKFGVKSAWAKCWDKKGTGGGSDTVVVAVIDTGVDYNHIDLKANMWKNTGEIDGNGIDDDSNGYVDDYYGVDMTAGRGSGMDDQGHGTHVAGIIAASNNKEGMVGLAYNAKIMTIKAGDASGYFLQNNIAEAIMYAYNHGADVINMSFGGSASSIAVQDALAVAYARCVLVAAAGNDGAPNQVADYYPVPLPNYPAAHSYVLGVMSVGENMVESPFSNWDCYLYNNVEYEVYAPGEQMMSTLPGNKYGKLSGTSMAAPVVAAQAALLRSYYSDMDKYPTKFIYGQIVGTADDVVKCANPEKHTVNDGPHNIPGVVNFAASMEELPTPDIGISDYTVFDTAGFEADTEGIAAEAAEVNNGDGIVDAGEIIALGLTLKNRWGMSENTKVTIDAISSGGVEHPYVEILNDEVDYGSVGTYSENDSGKIMGGTDGKLWTGWENPFYIKISKDCPNEYTVTLNVSVTYENGLDEYDDTVYKSKGAITLVIRRGTVLPNVIRQDMILTKDNYYIIPNTTTILEGYRVIVEPGTQIQFWCSDPSDAYAQSGIAYLQVEGEFLCQGTEEEPVEIFPSEWMGDYRVEITTINEGYASFDYTNITNGYITGQEATNCVFKQNYEETLAYRYLGGSSVYTGGCAARFDFDKVTDCAFYKLGSRHMPAVIWGGDYYRCIFVDSAIDYSYMSSAENCIFYGNHTETEGSDWTVYQGYHELTVNGLIYNPLTGKTYIAMNGFGSEAIARRFFKLMGGDLALLDEEGEIASWIHNLPAKNYVYYCGMYTENDVIYNYDGTLAKYEYPGLTLTPYGRLDYTHGNYESISFNTDVIISGMTIGQYTNFLAEIPGDIYITEVHLDEYLINLDTESSYQIRATVMPETADKATLVYESQDEEIVTVDENGRITPVGAGVTTVRVYAPDYAVYNYITVNVRDLAELESLAVAGGNFTMAVNTSKRVVVEYTPADTTRKLVTFESSNPEVAEVDDYGFVTAKSVGSTVITVTGDNDISTTVTVNVVIPAVSMAFTEDTYVTSLDYEDGTAFYPVIIPVDTTNQTLSWESSNPEVCYVDESGALVKLKEGTAVLKATLEGTDLSATVTVAVTNTNLNAKIVEMIEAGNEFFAVLDDGTLWHWGQYSNFPKKLLSGVKDIMIPNGSAMYILDNSGFIMRYSDPFDDFDNLSLDGSYFNLGKIVEITGSDQNCFALTENGAVWAWGRINHDGCLGIGNYEETNTPTLVEISEPIRSIVQSGGSTYFLSQNGNLYQAGGNNRYSIPQLIAEKVVRIDYLGSSSISIDYGTYIGVHNGSVTYQIIEKRNTSEIYGEYCYYIEDGSLFIKDSIYGSHLGKEYLKVNVSDVEYIFVLPGRVYIQTGTGEQYAFGDGTYNALGNGKLEDVSAANPVRIYFGFTENESAVAFESSNLIPDEDIDRILSETSIVLDYNQALIRGASYSSISITDSTGTEVTFTKELDLDKLIITPRTELKNGETYTLMIPAGALTDRAGTLNEELVLTFTYVEPTNYVVKMMEYHMHPSDAGINDFSSWMKIALLEDGSLWTWGETAKETVKLPFENVKDFYAWGDIERLDFRNYIYILTNDGILKKYVTENPLGDWQLDTSFTPMSGIKALGTSSHHVNTWFAITEDGGVYGWGDNSWYQLGTGNTISQENPMKLDFDEPIKKVVATDYGTAYLAESGNVYLSGGTTLSTPYHTRELVYTGAVDVYDYVYETDSYIYEYENYQVWIDMGNIIINWNFRFNNAEPVTKIHAAERMGTHAVYIEEGIPYVKCTHHYSQGWDTYIAIPNINDAVSIFAFYHTIFVQCENGDFYSFGCTYNGDDGSLGVNYTDNLEDGPFLIPFGNTDEIIPDEPVINDTVVDEDKLNDRHFWTVDEVMELWGEYVDKGLNTRFYSNVILNRLNDDNTSNWLRFTAGNGNYKNVVSLGGNYWGTTDLDLINKQILDYDDYNNLSDVNIGEILTEAPDDTFPFVVNAWLEVDEELVDTVGNDLVTFCVEFNRDMDTTIPLTVRFGSAYPYADYTVEGEYETPTLWKGTMQLTTIIENGYQYWSVSNGKAADTSLKLYTDWGRFPFKIDTTAAQALIMQAETTTEGIKLTWSQDDFDTLAGYNVYRSTEEDGLYTKLNTTVIPADVKEWFDGNVEPGETYYYNFTVVQTDFVESEPSGKVVVTAMDTMAPNIYHSPVYHAFTGSNLVISATVTDNVTINAATLYYRAAGSEAWNSKVMNNHNDKYSAIIPADVITTAGVEYYIEATDGISVTVKDNKGEPFVISVQTAVSDSDKGDVDGSGSVNVIDAMLVLQAANDRKNLTAEEFARADLDGSGKLEAWEALRILMYANGSIGSVLP